MAVKDSGEIATNSNYALGDYSFRIERTSVPGSTKDKLEAICTDKDGKNARKSIQVPSSTKLNGWYVEANETEATVYASISEMEGGDERTSPYPTHIPQPIPALTEVQGVHSNDGFITTRTNIITFYNAVACCIFDGVSNTFFIASTESNVRYHDIIIWHYESGQESRFERDDTTTLDYTSVVNGKTVHYDTGILGGSPETLRLTPTPIPTVSSGTPANSAYTMLYGTPSGGDYGEPKDMLVGRFAIEVEDAGGVGPGSDWVDPGDYDPDWEEGDPTHTLYVTVTGALSGRHNDPIEDPSYSYIPADKDTVKDYGCGGDGGHGGGGGAGASTVVIHKFATNQANSKEVTAIARRHGYGSGGGKGGKGGDGCILVYY